MASFYFRKRPPTSSRVRTAYPACGTGDSPRDAHHGRRTRSARRPRGWKCLERRHFVRAKHATRSN